MNLSENLLFVTVRLEGRKANGRSVGTGFLFQYEGRVFLPTNKHVIEDVTDGEYYIMRCDTSGSNWSPIVGQGVKFNFKESTIIETIELYLSQVIKETQ